MTERSKLTDALRQAEKSQQRVFEQSAASEQIIVTTDGVSKLANPASSASEPEPEFPNATQQVGPSPIPSTWPESGQPQPPAQDLHVAEPNLDAIESNALLETIGKVVDETATAANMPATSVPQAEDMGEPSPVTLPDGFRSQPTHRTQTTYQSEDPSASTSGESDFAFDQDFDPDVELAADTPANERPGPVLPSPIPTAAMPEPQLPAEIPAMHVGPPSAADPVRKISPTESPRVFLNEIQSIDDSPQLDSVAAEPISAEEVSEILRSVQEREAPLTSSVTTDSIYVEDPVSAANKITGWYEEPQEVPEDLPLYEIIPDAPKSEKKTNIKALAAAAISSQTPASENTRNDSKKQPPKRESPGAPSRQDSARQNASVATVAETPQQMVADATEESVAASPPHKAKQPTGFEISILRNLSDPTNRTQYEGMWRSIAEGESAEKRKSFSFMSCEPQAHVTEVAGHMAMFAANALKKQVLLVDGDHRVQRLSKFYGVSTRFGLSNILLQNSDWQDLVQPTANSNIVVLPAGTSAAPLGGFDVDELKSVAMSWSEHFDYIFVDNGQAYSTVPNPIYAVCDAAFLVLRLGETNRNEADQVIQQLLDSNVELHGCVVTNMP